MQRQTAKKMRVVDIVSGEFVKKEGMEPSFVVTPAKDNVSRARIVGTIVNKYKSEDGNFSSITLDDSTATIRVKLWKETGLIDESQTGDLVNLIGKVREYEGEIYMVPEIILKITPDEESMFRLEILNIMKKRAAMPAQASPAPKSAVQPTPAPVPKPAQEQPSPPEKSPVPEEKVEAVNLSEEKPKESPQAASVEGAPKQETIAPKSPAVAPSQPTLVPASEMAQQGDDNLRTKVMSTIEQNPDGIKYSELIKQLGASEEDMEDVINELLGEGVCYEPMPGKIKKI